MLFTSGWKQVIQKMLAVARRVVHQHQHRCCQTAGTITKSCRLLQECFQAPSVISGHKPHHKGGDTQSSLLATIACNTVCSTSGFGKVKGQDYDICIIFRGLCHEECAVEAMTQAESSWEAELSRLVLTDLYGLTQDKWAQGLRLNWSSPV